MQKPKNHECISLAKGGKLYETYWYYDDIADKGEYRVKDITNKAITKLFDPVELESDVTLKDIFLLLNTELLIFDSILRNWCKELVAEGLEKPGESYNLSKYDSGQIEYLELSKSIFVETMGGETNTYGLARPDFRGVGVVLQQDEEGFKKGERIPWGISLTPVNKLINIPVKLGKNLEVYKSNYDLGPKEDKEFGKVQKSYPNVEYTLGEILNGIIWELSFHGGPESRDKFSANLDKQVDDIKKQE